ncbi:hypothetical protein ACFYTS_10775 [Nocardia sp. NPDC004151]|uniref:hypothetical protein n=1 Tax=Nocardia sp. NPDC004151 TaxID=3364304 RepID=UPI0036B90C26
MTSTPTSTPSRTERVPHPDLFRQFPLSLARRALPNDPRPTRAQYAHYLTLTRVGDPPADNLVTWIQTQSGGQGRRLFEQAVEHGIESIDNPPAELVEFFEAMEAMPVWLDRDRIDIAQRATSRLPIWNVISFLYLGFAMSYLSSPANQVLIRTADLHKRAPRRIVETAVWWMEVTKPGGLDRYSVGFTSTARVRLTHAYMRAGMKKHPEWDSESWGDPVNQAQKACEYTPATTVASAPAAACAGKVTV